MTVHPSCALPTRACVVCTAVFDKLRSQHAVWCCFSSWTCMLLPVQRTGWAAVSCRSKTINAGCGKNCSADAKYISGLSMIPAVECRRCYINSNSQNCGIADTSVCTQQQLQGAEPEELNCAPPQQTQDIGTSAAKFQIKHASSLKVA